MVRMRIPKKELKKLKRQDMKEESIFRKDNEYNNLNDMLKQTMNEELVQHKKYEEKKKSLKDQFKSYIGKKKKRNEQQGIYSLFNKHKSNIK